MASKAIGFLNFKFSADLTSFERAMKKAQKKLKKFGKNLKKTGQTLTRYLTLPIVGLGIASVKAFDAQQKAIAQVEAGLKSTGNMVGFTSKKLQEMAADLQKTSLFGDEQILSDVTAQLLTFTAIAKEQFGETQLAVVNLATKLKTDLKSTAIMVGKALNDPVTQLSALSRNGVRFTEDQKELINSLWETGDAAGAQAIILKELETQFGGSAEAAAKAGMGPITQLMNQLSDLSEQIGQRLVPHMKKLVKWIVGLAEKFDGLTESQKDNIVKWGLIVAAIGPVLIILGTLSLALGALMTPLGLTVLAVGSLTTAFIYLKTSSSEVARGVRNSFTTMSNGILSNVNTAIGALNMLGANMDLYELDPLEEKGGKKFRRKVSFTPMKATDLLKNKTGLVDFNSVLEDIIENMDGLTTATEKYDKSLDPLIASMKEYADISTKMWQDGGLLAGPENMLNWTEKLTEAQKAHNATVVLFEDIMFSAAMSAANSQEDFFKSFIENIKKAIKQLLIQLAVMMVINLILGGPTMTIAAAFKGAKASVLGLEEGGLVTGPTTALIGEGVGTTASNPEVVAPLDKLKSMIGEGNKNIIVEGVLKGNDIYLSNKNTSINRLRTT